MSAVYSATAYDSRFAGWSRQLLVLFVAFLIGVIVYGVLVTSIGRGADTVAAPVTQTKPAAHEPANDDLRLYANIAKRVRQGESYYAAAVVEHRFNNYPLQPFYSVRLPTLAFVTANLDADAMRLLALVLAAITCLAWWQRLDGAITDPGRRFLAATVLFAGAAPLLEPSMLNLHETWAGMLIALALAIYRDDRAWPAILAGTLAVLLRETALPFLVLMAAFAFFERRWSQVTAWIAAMALLAFAMIAHAHALTPHVNDGALASPGWLGSQGYASYLHYVHGTTGLSLLPMSVAAILVPLSLVGWMSWNSRIGLRMTFLQLGYAVAFMIVGRPNTFYWGFLIAPTVLMGAMFLPGAAPAIRYAYMSRWQLPKQAARETV